jgi:hypothetical protein
MIEKHLIVISINDPIGLVNVILICCSGRQDSVQSPQFLLINRSFKSLTFWPLFCPFLSPLSLTLIGINTISFCQTYTFFLGNIYVCLISCLLIFRQGSINFENQFTLVFINILVGLI